MSIKSRILAVLGMFSLLTAGCTHTLPPHQEVNQALQKTLNSSGYNYTSKSRLTNLAVPVKDLKTTASKQQYLEKNLDMARGLSIIADGAIDMKNKKSEVLYNLHYDQDNVEVSIKVPLLFDYTTQTLYVGTTLFNTIFPMAPGNQGKLIRIDLNDLLKLAGEKSDKLKNLLGKKYFDSVNEGLKQGVLKGFADLKDERFSDQPLTGDDAAAGLVRHITVRLDHEESVALLLTIADTLVQRLYQDGVLGKEEYGTLMILTDKQKIDSYLAAFRMAATLDIGLGSTGQISRIESRFTVVGKDNRYQVGVENISRFSRYNDPLFTIRPELTGAVDHKEILDSILAARAAQKAEAEANKAKEAEPEAAKEEKKIGE
ncbi:hypothetical protein FY034_01465 [Trichlorobacter lovleyi]|uniref:hypothetical protein n=1 Tax=Trichlorobacter lovleyi TaxID=313985 RepID=UPI002240D8EB|nr:hypothetical protein [Trichlorobacter lovleyi]QOX77660.1 hypothetical protein FY034_01465 [Trichlorobacter lovleyi]